MVSGIEELKKKTKLSLDEMYETHEEMEEKHKKIKVDKKQPIKPESFFSSQQTTKDSLHIEEVKGQIIAQQKDEKINESPLYNSSKTPQKTPTYKMTFSLPEEIQKAFNNLYAKRILNGRQTEKSELICEAIHLLIKAEENV